MSLCVGSLLTLSAGAGVRHKARPADGNPPSGSVLYNFCTDGGQHCTDGVYPMGRLVQGSDGNYYGVTEQGGINGEAFGGYGTVYQLTPGGTVTTVYSFCTIPSCSDGIYPEDGLVVGSDGNFYGVTNGGGAADGFGTVFKLTTAGVLTTLYTFQDATDGAYPSSPLVLGNDGNFYGTTENGGAIGPGGSGTIFKLTPAGAFTTVYSFCSLANCVDGESPEGGLLQGSDGNFYGTTAGGGSDSSGCVGDGCGTIYELTPAGVLTTLYNFQDGADGASPEAGLTQASDGSFYGSTITGGTPSDGCGGYGCGTIFSFLPSGQSGALTTVYSFTGAADEGIASSGLLLASDGNFYGATSYYTGGTVFSMTPSGTLSTLYTFCSETNCTDGEMPSGGLLQGSDGNFYGVTNYGGANEVSNGGAGVAYKVSYATPLAAPVTLTVSAQPYQNRPATVAFTVSNAYSLTSQQCYAYATNQTTPAFYPLGKVTGTLHGSVYSGTYTVTPPTAGTYLAALTCGGTTTGFVSGTVLPTHVTALALTASPNPVLAGGTVVLTATATRTDNSGTPVGSVNFYYGTYFLGSATLNGSGVATLTASSSIAAFGSYGINAVYGGDSQDGASTSNTVTVVTEKGSTSTTLTANPNPVTRGQACTLTATVATNGGAVSGTVSFYAGTNYLGFATVSGGVATLAASTNDAPLGTYSVTAVYSGSKDQNGSTSAPVSVTVVAAN